MVLFPETDEAVSRTSRIRAVDQDAERNETFLYTDGSTSEVRETGKPRSTDDVYVVSRLFLRRYRRYMRHGTVSPESFSESVGWSAVPALALTYVVEQISRVIAGIVERVLRVEQRVERLERLMR